MIGQVAFLKKLSMGFTKLTIMEQIDFRANISAKRGKCSMTDGVGINRWCYIDDVILLST